MERYYSQTVGTEVITEGGLWAGRILDVIVEPETGKICGFLMAPRGRQAIVPLDILYWSNRMIIHDVDDIIETQEIIKIQRILEKNISIIQKKVVTEKGEYLGRVFDYTIDNKLFIMTKILVAKSFLRFFPYDERVIAHKNIVEIKKDVIVVRNSAGIVRAHEKKTAKVKEKLNVDPAPTPL